MSDKKQAPKEYTEKEISYLGRHHRGHCYERTKHVKLEKAFAEAWLAKNKISRNYHVNFGYGILQDLLIDPHPAWHRIPCARIIVNMRERVVAATVVQWLGSNVGMGFLSGVLDSCGYKIVKK